MLRRRRNDESAWVVIVMLIISLLLAAAVGWYSDAHNCEYNYVTKILDCPDEEDEGE